jgi:S-DNA-T family DNA segregation ATPase FtsK/SpoIIIE
MAYGTRRDPAYGARRDPLLDEETAAIIERRGRELGGLGLLACGAALLAAMWSYASSDPSWLAATDGPVANWLGRPGAALASPLRVIVGGGAYAAGAILLAWGVRFVLHRGHGRAASRLLLAPLAVAAASLHAATLAPGAGWAHSFGLGGLFGDTVLGALLTALPVSTEAGLRGLSALSGAAALALGLHAAGVTRAEASSAARFLLRGTVLSYAGMMGRAGRGAARFGAVARARAERRAEAAPQPSDGDEVARAGLVSRVRAVGAGLAERLGRPPRRPTAEAPVHRAAEGRVDLGRREPPVVGSAAPSASTTDVGRDPSEADPQEAWRVVQEGLSAFRAEMGGRDVAAPRVEPKVAARPSRPEAPEVDAPETEAPGPELPRFLSEREEAPARPAAPAAIRRGRARPAPVVAEPAASPAYEHPPLDLLTDPGTVERHHLADEQLAANARLLEGVLDDYGVKGEIVSVRPGPVVTMYELEPAPGLKASRVIGLADDIARSMSALSARVSTVPGRSVIGIELPNEKREKVVLREILSAAGFDGSMRLPLALGKDIGGDPVVANLAKMPHLLIAGTTGSGKSVAINTMILSLLYTLSPEECRLIMIDPKMLELSVYDGIPHLLSPVVTDPKKAVVALKWVVAEMEERYRRMSKLGVRNIEGFNGRVRDALARGETFTRTVQTGFDDDTGEPVWETEETTPEAMPYIVVVVDEMADLMMVAGKEIEACIQRLAQMARASGIHIVMATQRPSVDVITGTIKANFPTRISFQVTSKVDSRTILGEMGAEQLLGMGDMLHMAGGAKITRVHGPFVSDREVEEVVAHLKSLGPPEYVGAVVEGPEEGEASVDAVLGLDSGATGDDALYDQAVAIVAKDRKCSTSYIQRKLGIGYNKAARLVEQMEDEGVVSPSNHVGKRDVLVPEAP